MSKSGLMLFKLNMSYLLSYFTVIPCIMEGFCK